MEHRGMSLPPSNDGQLIGIACPPVQYPCSQPLRSHHLYADSFVLLLRLSLFVRCVCIVAELREIASPASDVLAAVRRLQVFARRYGSQTGEARGDGLTLAAGRALVRSVKRRRSAQAHAEEKAVQQRVSAEARRDDRRAKMADRRVRRPTGNHFRVSRARDRPRWLDRTRFCSSSCLPKSSRPSTRETKSCLAPAPRRRSACALRSCRMETSTRRTS